MLVEPVQGEGGYYPAPPRFLEELRSVCDEHGIMLVFDEVQTGFGRTAEWFASDHYSVNPDIIALGKGIANGFPLSAYGAPADIMNDWPVGSHGTTFGGNPVSCAAAVAVLDTMGDLLPHARDLSKRAFDRLADMAERHPTIGDVRGLGLMIGIELVSDPEARTESAEAFRHVHEYCLERELIVIECGPDGNVIRFIPPLITTTEELDWALGLIDEALTDWEEGEPEVRLYRHGSKLSRVQAGHSAPRTLERVVYRHGSREPQVRRMRRRDMKRAMTLFTVLGLALAACGGDDATETTIPTTGPTSTAGDSPQNVTSSDVLLTVTSEGGFVPVEFNLDRMPRYVLLADGTLFYQGPVPAIFPGPLLPNVQVTEVTATQMDEILQLVEEMGLPEIDEFIDDSNAEMVADATTEFITYYDENGTHRLGIYALGITEGGGSTERILANELIEVLERGDRRRRVPTLLRRPPPGGGRSRPRVRGSRAGASSHGPWRSTSPRCPNGR
jgi:hypothetical protein